MARKIIRKKRRVEEHPALELMRRRHYQIIIHSFIYYELGENLISDQTFDAWGKELGNLIQEHPECLDELEHGYEFRDYTGGTGYHLNFKNPRVVSKALHLFLHSGKPIPDSAWNYLDRKTKNYYDKSIKQEEETKCQHQSRKPQLKKRLLRKRQ